ncbi:MAG: hypothetical protein N2321_10040 [Melioribacteraceae bacterium]|nr:hypothetical protein [Melioribacteraceae bacterium]
MIKKIFYISVLIIHSLVFSQIGDTIKLNGIVDFQPTYKSFPPEKFEYKIKVPGLVDFAEPKLPFYEEIFNGKNKPRYYWYKFNFNISNSLKGKFYSLKILKSSYYTQVYLNGFDCGTYLQSTTPIEINITKFIRLNETNELLVRVADISFLPKEAATGVDREKIAYIPGIWDVIFIKVTNEIKIKNQIVLPYLEKKKLIVKYLIENLSDRFDRDLELTNTFFTVKSEIKEKGNTLYSFEVKSKIQSTKTQELHNEIDFENLKLWNTVTPNLYSIESKIIIDSVEFKNYGNQEIKRTASFQPYLSDVDVKRFGIREFKSKENYFTLNSKRIFLTGSTITLNRFLEDKERADLPWNKEWVKKLIIDLPKKFGWNTLRISLGLLPDFWYDLADEYGILLQNEYPMWNLRGENSELKKEFTNWIWNDANHPSIVIWDALNENVNDFIVKELIPELKKIDNTRIWDAGWTGFDGKLNLEMKEIHWYSLGHGWWVNDNYVTTQRNKYRFGSLQNNYNLLDEYKNSTIPLLLNEYGWFWQNREGTRSAIRTYGEFRTDDVIPFTKNYEYFEMDGTQLYSYRDIYDYYLGQNASKEERENFQSYILNIETEFLRASKYFAGVLSFSYLSNNNGYTGDWFESEITKLIPKEPLFAQANSMRPFATFIDLEDGRYLKNPVFYKPKEKIKINLIAVNDTDSLKSGNVKISLINTQNKIVNQKSFNIILTEFERKQTLFEIALPDYEDNFLVKSELYNKEYKTTQVSIRYIRASNKNIFPKFVFGK